ncbi:MAG: 2,3-diphosphoglycerate-dependent phosphoglycerate mutase [Enterobacterales bacterium]
MCFVKLVLVRHGESIWNKENKFTGWTDIDLSKNGVNEANNAGNLLKVNKYKFDIAYTSILKRAINTLLIILNVLNQKDIYVNQSWKLNERHYGALQGLNKDEVINKYGYKQVYKWRRSLKAMPPYLFDKESKEFASYCNNYINIDKKNIPISENLELTMNRVYDYWENEILHNLLNKKKIIIVSHGNTLRAMTYFLDNLNESELLNLNIPTGIPIIYEFNNKIQPIRHYYLK